MQQKKVAFIYSSAFGHLYRSVLIAKYYISKGYEVKYFVSGGNEYFFKQYPFLHHKLLTYPFGQGMEKFKIQNLEIKLTWWKELLSRISGKHFHARKLELESIIEDYQPDLLFLDIFCSTDFIVFYPYLKNRKCFILSTFLPNFPNNLIPPTKYYAFPNNEVKGYWCKFIFLRRLKAYWEKIKFLNYDNTGIVWKRFKEQNIPMRFKPMFIFENLSFFKNIQILQLQAKELDFPKRSIPEFANYVGPLIDLNRDENFTQQYQLFLRLASSNPKSKIIYCSFGTVSASVLADESLIFEFYNILIEIALNKPNFYFLIKLDARMKNRLTIKSLNCMLFDYVPQIDILKKADVFIMHGGEGSFYESIYTITPMLVVPISKKWDHQGYAARIVYHNLGIKCNLNESSQKIQNAIFEIINNESYKLKLYKFRKILINNYNPEKMLNKLLP